MSTQKNNRVLSRLGARELDEKETNLINGAVGTQTFCSFDPRFGPDGDFRIGEC